MIDWAGRIDSVDNRYSVTWGPGGVGGKGVYIAVFYTDSSNTVPAVSLCVSDDIKECIQKCERHAALGELVRDAEQLGLYDTDREDINEQAD